MADLIDRDGLRKDFCNMCEAMQPEMIDCERNGCMSMQIIDEQQTVNRWISCDEKLPDDGQICIVKRKFSYKVPCPYMIGVWSSDRNIFFGLRLGTELEDAISWMPFIDPDEV